jgi:hypothetical protein
MALTTVKRWSVLRLRVPGAVMCLTLVCVCHSCGVQRADYLLRLKSWSGRETVEHHLRRVFHLGQMVGCRIGVWV